MRVAVHLKDRKHDTNFAQKYAWIFFLEHYLFLKVTVFLELHFRKTVRILEQIMSVDKYSCIFTRQIEAIVYSFYGKVVLR